MLTFPSSPVMSPPKPFQHFPFSSSPGVTLPLHSKTWRKQPSSSLIHSLPQQVETFWEWLSDQKVVTQKSPVRPGLGPEGLGLFAQRDIGRNEVVLEVPKRLWINPDMVSGSEIGSACSGLKPWVSVAVFLINEKLKAESFWRAYLDVLPESTDSTIYWSEEELAELQGTQLSKTTIGIKNFLQQEFAKLQEEVLVPLKHVFPSSISLDDFVWAFGILRSRAFSRLRGENLVLIPLADLDNSVHRIGPNASKRCWNLLSNP